MEVYSILEVQRTKIEQGNQFQHPPSFHSIYASYFDAGASINAPNIGNSALIIEELDWGGQEALNTCENSFFGPHLGLGRQKNVVKLRQTPDVELPY